MFFTLSFILSRLNAEQQYAKKKKAELASLGEWTHINCLTPPQSAVIVDEVLQTVVTMTSTPAAIEREIDDFEVGDNNDVPNNIPGGTISFIFEKISRSQT